MINTPSKIDESLFPLIAAGNCDAFKQLYYSTDKAVFGYILSIVRNTHDAEDIMQDTYVKIRNSAEHYIPCGKPLAWIFTIAKNLCLSKLRKNSRTVSTDYDDLQEYAIPDFACDRLDNLVLKTALTILSEVDCQIVILHAVTGYKHSEIAKTLGIPLPTVLSKYSRSLAKLKKELREEV
ncbi:MAG: RNA polymerase sigma factor [Oscillospiraceae bacterium]